MFQKYSLITFVVLISYFKVQCKPQEGSPCHGKKFKSTCVPIEQCRSAVHDIKQNLLPQLCKFEGGKKIICCSDCELVNNTSTILVDKLGWYYDKTGQKARDKCLEYMVDLKYSCLITRGLRRYEDKTCYGFRQYHYSSVVGGVNAKRGQYPHMALLGYGIDQASALWLCGGSVISEKFILTAGHCISTPKNGPVKYVGLGILKRSDASNKWQIYHVKKIIPYYEYQAPFKYHDIALLEVETTIKFNRLVLPACLHTGDLNEQTAIAAGWGILGEGKGLSDTLQVVTLEQYPKQTCKQFYPNDRLLINGYNETIQSCYGDRYAIADTCEGDSGGPLIVSHQNKTCMSVIIGVTSYGKTCGNLGNAGMYTRVSHYIPWIESIVWP